MEIQKTISIGQLGDRTGLAVSAIRYYEEVGLVHPERNAGGQRRFLKSDIRRLSFVLIAQKFGFSIEQIREQFDKLPDRKTPNARDWQRISKTFRKELDDKIDTLTRLRDNLDGCIGCGCLSLTKCKLYNPDDKAAVKGPGARYLLGDRPDDI